MKHSSLITRVITIPINTNNHKHENASLNHNSFISSFLKLISVDEFKCDKKTSIHYITPVCNVL